MSIFSKKEEYYDDEEGELEETSRSRRIKDLNPGSKKKRKEPTKPWGKKERLFILSLFFATVLTAGISAASARDWKLPGLPRLKLSKPSLNFNFLGEETISIGKKPQEAEKSENAIKAFKDKTDDLSGVYALYVLRLDSGVSYGVNEDEVRQAASLIKLPLMAAVYMESEKGGLSLSDKAAGQARTYQELVAAMGKRSDNEAFRIVRNTIGDTKINEVIRKFGMTKTNVEENETSPKDIGIFFEKLWKAEQISKGSRDAILNDLTDTIFEDWLVAGIPDVRVAHKYGREVHVVNDAGIVFTQKPFVLVIMTQGVVEREADEVIAELAKAVYEIEK